MMKQAMKMMGGKGGMPDLDNMSQADIEAAAKAMGGKLPGMGGLPGLGGLGGLSGLGKKK
jgi:signal recognition particle subunit SRP54